MNKKISISFILILMLFLILFPEKSGETVKETLISWYRNVLPPLFPSLILIKMFLGSNIQLKNPGFFCICSGIFCGFPIGATTSTDYVKKHLISPYIGLLYSALFNQFSLPFMISYISITCLNESPFVVIILLYSAQILILFVAMQLHKSKSVIVKNKETIQTQKNETFATHVNYKVVDASILSSCEALIKICGYMVICNLTNTLILTITNNPSLNAIVAPILELSSGTKILCASSLPAAIKYSLVFACVSFGGISGLLQVYDIIKQSGLSFRSYIKLKVTSFFVTGAIAYIYYFVSH